MFPGLKFSFAGINYRLFVALVVLGLVPTIYTSVRIFFLGRLPGESGMATKRPQVQAAT